MIDNLHAKQGFHLLQGRELSLVEHRDKGLWQVKNKVNLPDYKIYSTALMNSIG